MLARKLKCPSCGGNKINEITTGYIYCDYCSSLMGYDMENMANEAAEVFSLKNYSKPLQKSFIETSKQLGDAINNNNRSDFLRAQLELHRIEFELFPKRFGPKAKQPAYREKYMVFFEKFWNEKLDNDYIKTACNASKNFEELGTNLKSNIIDGKVAYEFNTDFVKYIDAISDYNRKSIAESMKMECIAHYPEPFTPATPDLMYKQGVNNMIQQFEVNTAKKVIEMLGLQEEYMEIEAVQVTEMDCHICSTSLKVPEGSESIICETCGNINNVKSNEVQCLNCSAPYEINENNECPYCGAKVIAIGKKTTVETSNQQSGHHTSEKKTGGLFGKLFGKN